MAKSSTITTSSNRKSTTSHHHHHKLISEESSSSSSSSLSQATSSTTLNSVAAQQKSSGMLRTNDNPSNLKDYHHIISNSPPLTAPAATITTTTVTMTMPIDTTAPNSSSLLARPSLRLRLNNQLKGELFDRAAASNGLLESAGSRALEVQQEEESSVHHRESFSSSTTASMRDGSLRKAAVASSSSSSASEAARLSRLTSAHINGSSQQISADLSASSSRHFKTSASLYVSGGKAGGGESLAPRPSHLGVSSELVDSSRAHGAFLNSDPDVCSLVKEIGSEFAELENALTMTSSASHLQRVGSGRSESTLSTRLFGGRRLLSPIRAAQDCPAISNSSSERSLFNSMLRDDDYKDDHSSLSLTRKRLFDKENEEERRSSGDRITELISKAQSQAERYSSATNKTKLSEPNSAGERQYGSSPGASNYRFGQYRLTTASTSDSSQASPKTDVEVKVLRLDQRMSELCTKLNECHDTKKAIDFLKVMIQMIEKAWSVPHCGDDLGFKLCNSLREAGGLDIILGFIQDSDELPNCSGPLLLAPPSLQQEANSSNTLSSWMSKRNSGNDNIWQQNQQNTKSSNSSPAGVPNLRLNLSKVHQQDSVSRQSLTDSASSTPQMNANGGRQSPPNHRVTNNTNQNSSSNNNNSSSNKDSDSDVLTSGFDSTSVESLSYVSESQVTEQAQPEASSQQEQPNDDEPPNLNSGSTITGEDRSKTETEKEKEKEEEKKEVLEQSQAKENSMVTNDYHGLETKGQEPNIKTENDCDPEKNEEVIVSANDSETLDEEEASLRKEELVFLSAHLLSQCLTSDNRDYIVKTGLNPVIKLACYFTTMKSSQSHRLLARSIIMRQSSTVGLAVNSNALKHTSTVGPIGKTNSSEEKVEAHVKSNAGDDRTASVVSNEGRIAGLGGSVGRENAPTNTTLFETDHSDMHAIIGTEILQHLFKHSEDTCSKMISLGALSAILYACRSSNVETLRHCASALANLALYGGPDSQQTMVEQKAHVWLFPLAFNEDDNIQYYACLAIVVLAANQEIEADVLKSSTLDLVEPFVTSHEPQRFAESTTAHVHGQSASWLRKLIPLLESRREEARNLACFHFAMEAYIKREQGQTQVFKDIGALEPLRKAGSSPIAIASKFACQALRLIGEKEPHKLSQQIPLWTCEDVVEWVGQIGFERFNSAFIESRVDGDLLLQIDEEMLKSDIGIENGIIRRRFLRELSNLKRIADYSSVDKSNLSSLLTSSVPNSISFSGREFKQYIYQMVQLGVTKDNIHLLDCDQLLMECKVSNPIHRMKLAHAIKEVQERVACIAASNESDSSDGADQKTLDVFVSYRRSTGSQLASLLKVHLQLRGFSVFIDVERLEAGKFDNNLLSSIKTAKNFILVLSPNALDRCIGDIECKDWVHKEIVAALASGCNIIPIIDNFHWPEAEQLPEDMRTIPTFNGVRWSHDYQDACVDKVERFMKGDFNICAGSSSAQSSLQRGCGLVSGYPSTPSIVATPSVGNFSSASIGGTGPTGLGGYSGRTAPPFDADHHPLSFAGNFHHHQHSQQFAASIRR